MFLPVAAMDAQTTVDLSHQTRNADFSLAPFTKPSKTGTTLPANCSVGETFFKTNAAAGQNLYGCTATDIWTLLGGVTATGVNPGTYGAVTQVPQLTVNSEGQITAAANLAFNGVTNSTDLTDCKVTLNASTVTVATPCKLTSGSTVQKLTGSATATLSGTAANGALYLYWDRSGRVVADENTPASVACNTQCVTASTGGFAAGSFPLAIANFTSNLFTDVVDQRAIFSNKNVNCGAGVTCVEDTATGELTVTPETSATLLAKSTHQSGQALRCSSSVAGSAHTCNMSPTLAGYTAGMVVEFTPAVAALSGAGTLNIDGLGARAIKKADGLTDPAASEVAVGQQVPLRYDGSVFRLPAGLNEAPLGAGSFSAMPVCNASSSGTVYLLSNSLYPFTRCDGTSWVYYYDGRSVTAPGGSWSWDNATQGGSATVDTSRGFHLLSVPGAHTTGFAVRYTTAPAAPYTRVFAVRLRAALALESVGYMIGFRDSTGKLHGLELGYASGVSANGYYLRLARWTNPTTFLSADAGPMEMLGLPPQALYVRIEDDNTNLKFSYSTDGYDFHEVGSVSRTAHLSSPAEIFFAARAGGASSGAAMDVISIQ